MPNLDIKKLYYSISEVCELTGIEQHVLRFWESEFKELNPRKSSSGKRQYRDSDIKIIEQIKRLRYDKGFKIEGARRELTGRRHQTGLEPASDQDSKLQELRTGLLEIQKILDS